jgi:hypothetical protein
MADRRAPVCHCEKGQRRSNPQKRDEQDCRFAIAPRNDNEGFVCPARHNEKSCKDPANRGQRARAGDERFGGGGKAPATDQGGGARSMIIAE